MRVIVHTAQPDCAAHLALRTEGIPHEVILATGQYDYAEMFYATWNAGEPFVLVEWDIVPWPGAIDGLAACSEPWCAHRYPFADAWECTAPENRLLEQALGCVKVRPLGPAPVDWLQIPWKFLDGSVVPVLRELFGPEPHLHEPPVAHARPK